LPFPLWRADGATAHAATVGARATKAISAARTQPNLVEENGDLTVNRHETPSEIRQRVRAWLAADPEYRTNHMAMNAQFATVRELVEHAEILLFMAAAEKRPAAARKSSGSATRYVQYAAEAIRESAGDVSMRLWDLRGINRDALRCQILWLMPRDTNHEQAER
jgi:hypothetical protein